MHDIDVSIGYKPDKSDPVAAAEYGHPMEFRILGPLYADAGSGSGPAEIWQPLLRSALAVLLLRANRTCSRRLLIEALWGSDPPAAPEPALRVCISRLRQSLGECAGRLNTVGPPGGRAPGHRLQRGYVMHVRPGELDVDEFTDLAAQGQSELDSGNAAAAAASFVQALALWGDPLLPDLPDSPALASDIARLVNHRQAVMDALIDARLEAGEHDQILAQLRAAVVADPGRERTCEQLMRACHSVGLRKEALDVYQMARRATLEQQGAEPGPALGVLYRRILAEETATDNYGLATTRRPASPPRLHGWQPPAAPADFVGREREVAAIVSAMRGPGVPVAVVSGVPGIGKSAAASVAAVQLRGRFPDGQLYASLGGVSSPRNAHDVVAEVLQTMGIPAPDIPEAGQARAAMFRSLLSGRKVLVIADDAVSAAQVRPLIPAAGGAAVIVTSRSRLSGLAGARHIEIGGLPDDEALSMLNQAASSQRVSAYPEAARAIVERCGGMPLALRLSGEVLAARPGLSPAALALDLAGDHALDVLIAEDVSVREAIGASYRAVSPEARTALSLLAVNLPGEISPQELADAAQGNASVLDQLAAVGLLSASRTPHGTECYKMHALVRAYCAGQQKS